MKRLYGVTTKVFYARIKAIPRGLLKKADFEFFFSVYYIY